jgi:hypothetical protein
MFVGQQPPRLYHKCVRAIFSDQQFVDSSILFHGIYVLLIRGDASQKGASRMQLKAASDSTPMKIALQSGDRRIGSKRQNPSCPGRLFWFIL